MLRSCLGFVTLLQFADAGAKHGFDQLMFVNVLHSTGQCAVGCFCVRLEEGDVAAIAQDGGAVADASDLGEAMGYEDSGAALFPPLGE